MVYEYEHMTPTDEEVRGWLYSISESRAYINMYMYHAYELPSKKDQVRGEGRFSLTMTLENLHVQFMRENPTIRLCFSSFCNARTPNIRLIRFTHRKQCLCRKCANICLKSDVVKALPKNQKA